METTAKPLPRRERERLVRRSEMLRAAQEVFAEKGYSSATLEEVAARAEYGKGTLYNYFPGGKQEILLAIVERFHDELCAIITRSFDDSQQRSFRDSLAAFFGESFAFFFERTELFVTLLREAHRIGLSDDLEPRQFFSRQRERALEALAGPIKVAMDRGEIRSVQPHLIAHMILVNLNGAQMRSCMPRSQAAQSLPQSAPDMADFLTNLVMDGLGQPAMT